MSSAPERAKDGRPPGESVRELGPAGVLQATGRPRTTRSTASTICYLQFLVHPGRAARRTHPAITSGLGAYRHCGDNTP